jgi:hypothetical protein
MKESEAEEAPEETEGMANDETGDGAQKTNEIGTEKTYRKVEQQDAQRCCHFASTSPDS